MDFITKKIALPYWRLSGFYAFYFAFIGVWIPFWNLYLEQQLRFTAMQIAVLTSIPLITKLVTPYWWGWVADNYHCRSLVIRLGALLSLLCFMPIMFTVQYQWMIVVMAVFGFFWNAILSQFEVVTLSHLQNHTPYYSQIRVWGSIGFVVTVLGLGAYFDHFSLTIVPVLLCFCLLFVTLMSFLVSERAPSKASITQSSSLGLASSAAFWRMLFKPPVITFFIVCFLVQFSHGPYYTFFSIYLDKLGYNSLSIGWYWAIGVIIEIMLFLVIHRWIRRYQFYHLMLITLVLTLCRWLLIAFLAQSMAWLLLAQCLHAASFASVHALAIDFIQHYFSSARGQAQAMLGSLTYGLGLALGGLASGYLWDEDPRWVFVMAAGVIVVAIGVWMARERWWQSPESALTQTASLP